MAVKPPTSLPRTDSGPPVSARDASYWMSVACNLSSSRSNGAPTVSASSSSRNLDASSCRMNMRDKSFEHRDPINLQHEAMAAPLSLNDSSFSAARPEVTTAQDHPSEDPRLIIVAEEVYEYQRCHMVLGWGSKGHLLPLDPDKYMRVVRHCMQIRKRQSQGIRETEDDDDVLLEWSPSATFPTVTLPDPQTMDKPKPSKRRSRSAATLATSDKPATLTPGNAVRASRWEWASPWHLELPESSPKAMDGWQYASSFSQFCPRPLHRLRGRSINAQSQSYFPGGRALPSSSPSSSSGKRLRVRRRKWVRYRRLRSGRRKVSRSTSSSAFDDAFLDSMSGWLRKRGHVRKNWKYRYFVLHQSVLRYYSDSCCTNLKGEVLLFHPLTCVHYVDVHVAGGRDACFAIQVGSEYALLLQATQLSDRENWMYCIEDALLCRNSYHPLRVANGAMESSFDLRESVAQRRLLSAEAMALDGPSFRANACSISHYGQKSNVLRADGREDRARTSSGCDLLHLWASLHAKPGGVLSAVSSASPTLCALLRECDHFLASKPMRRHIATFLVMFRQKYDRASVTAAAWTRLSEPWTPGSTGNESDSDHELRDGSVEASLYVTNLQDARSLLALKNYRFFLERSLELIMDHLATFATVRPREGGVKATLRSKWEPRDDEWAFARRAALYKLERRTFIPLQESIYKLLGAATGSIRVQQQDEEEQFERLRQRVATYPQSFLEIQPSHQSTSAWKSAIALLNSMDNYSLPSEKAAVLVEVARCIFETHGREHHVAMDRVGELTQPTMAADDFLPIFIFVLARCRLRSIIVTRHLISETMITALMIGETGYYATMLEAAIGFIASFDDAAKVGDSVAVAGSVSAE